MLDIQATQQAATGSVITAAIRLRGISIGATGTAGVLDLNYNWKWWRYFIKW
jgi:hypothetical protein